MKYRLSLTLLLSLFISSFAIGQTEKNIKIIFTTDVHGNYFPRNFTTQKDWGGSLARVHEYVENQRRETKGRVLLLDNGDILQGQPTAYYSNYIDTVSPHICSQVMNFMKYDAGNVGNHDVETGRNVMARWIHDCKFPILGANIMKENSNIGYLRPYEIFKVDGVRVAVLGMITPAIPVWLPQNLWKGLYFADMEATAEKWMKVLQEEEQPDVIIGLFHAGKSPKQMGDYLDNASYIVGENIPGFDVVMYGHDHARSCETIENTAGQDVWMLNPANNAVAVGVANIKLTFDQGSLIDKEIQGEIVDLKDTPISKSFMKKFNKEYNTINQFVSKKIGNFKSTITTRDAYFGSSAFIDLIHSLQLDITKADVSFVAPLSFDTSINEGNIYVSDMFNLYKYENMLYVMNMTGKEIKNYLEMSYDQWVNTMKSSSDHLLLLKEKRTGDDERSVFVNRTYNFDSAAGIKYLVDVTKDKGHRVTILSMADGKPFSSSKTYKVALNSYRGNGGGELLTKGAGIPHDQLRSRIVYASDKDLRYYLMRTIEEKKILNPQPLNQWKFIPENWVKDAAARDYELLFGSSK